MAAGSCRTERTAQAVQRRRHQKTRCIGERELVSNWASESRDLLGCESEQGPPRWRHGAETLQLWILAAFPALANRRTLSTGHSQGHIGAGVDELIAGVATSSRGCWLSAASLQTMADKSPCGLPLGTRCSSTSCTLHAGSTSCQAHGGAQSAGLEARAGDRDTRGPGYDQETSCGPCKEGNIMLQKFKVDKEIGGMVGWRLPTPETNHCYVM